VFEARAQIAAAKRFLAEKPDTKEADRMRAVCSLAVEAATMQLALVEAQADADSLRGQLGSTRNKLNDTHKQILATQQDLLALERRTASRLKADLDTEKRKAEKLREEAEKKFNELQSELISVKTDARGTIISMSDILFDVNKATLTENLKTNLAKISGILTVFKEPDIIVEGHTDNQGTAEYNQKLSEARAENVMNFMIEQGIDESRLSSVGYGLTKPVADNSTKEGRAKNRRVDLIIQDKK
jgi:outer membrane protein OmpA-like peptidoglycan-associated protein